ncbi:MAG: hypothetical protein LC793_20475 [Thermomicrobia bacterium]|nr:hypothetical protein [Thermomicrobia bacterium]
MPTNPAGVPAGTLPALITVPRGVPAAALRAVGAAPLDGPEGKVAKTKLPFPPATLVAAFGVAGDPALALRPPAKAVTVAASLASLACAVAVLSVLPTPLLPPHAMSSRAIISPGIVDATRRFMRPLTTPVAALSSVHELQ